MSEHDEAVVPDTGIDVSKVLRLRQMLEQLREEVRQFEADAAGLERLASIHNEIELQLTTAVSGELGAELAEFSSCCAKQPGPSQAEIRVAQAQLMGWIEGLLQGVQVSFNITQETEADSEMAIEEDSENHSSGLYL
jgi:hypothetical protein